MEVIIPSPSMEFDFGIARSSSCMLTAPPTPRRFGEYYCFSAPTSPSRMADFYRDFDEFSTSENGAGASPSSVPFGWEERMGKQESPELSKDDVDLAFSVCEDLERASLSAEELFDGGKIRALKPPPMSEPPDKYKVSATASGLQGPTLSPPRSPVLRGRMITGKAPLMPQRKSKESVSIKPAMEKGQKKKPEQERGRGHAPFSGSGRRAARSLSPYRVSSHPWEEEQEKEKQQLQKLYNNNNQNQSSPSTPISSSKGSGTASKKWRLKDFFLFRSASEGRAADKDPFRKYAAVFKRQEDTSSGQPTKESPGSILRRRSGPISAHELHYTVNKAVMEDLKKRTFLPYKRGILGRLAFNPAVHGLANGFGSLYR